MRAFNDFMSSGPGGWEWLGMLLIVTPLVTFWHELGHAVAARRLLGGDVRIEVGEGVKRWERRFAGIDLSIGSFTRPIGIAGRCIYTGYPSAGEQATIALAGPAATLLGFVLSVAVLSHSNVGSLHSLAWMATMLQGAGLVLNLIPIEPLDGFVAREALRHVQHVKPARAPLPAAEAPFEWADSPPCGYCGHRRDEHISLETGRRAGCRGQHYDFQTLTPHACPCPAYIHLSSN